MRFFLTVLIFFLVTGAWAQDFVVTEDTIGCLDRKQYSDMSRLLAEGEKALFETEMRRAIARGQCGLVKRGTLISVRDYEFWAGMSQVRPAGQTVLLWIRNTAFAAKR